MTTCNFDNERKAALVEVAALKDPQIRVKVRAFFLNCIRAGKYRNICRAHGHPIEKELMERLDAFTVDKTHPLWVHNLKLIRRFLLQRYAFSSVRKVDKHLSGKVSRFWLWKDYAIPRIGLSLVIGFGGAMGSSAIFDWLGGLRGLAAVLVALACLLLVFILVYLNVRDVITGAHLKDVRRRTPWVFAVAVSWVGIALLAADLLNRLMGWRIDWRHGALTGCVALVLAVLTQFFFTKAGSMGEPL